MFLFFQCHLIKLKLREPRQCYLYSTYIYIRYCSVTK